MSDTPARSGFASEVIARNAAAGAAAERHTAMATKDLTIAAGLFNDIPGIDTAAAEAIQDWFEARYTLTRKTRPDNQTLGQLVAKALHAPGTQSDVGAALVAGLLDEGYVIRPTSDDDYQVDD